jgi:phosphoribosylglycinamide formyltransferase 2
MNAKKILLLGSGELGREFVISVKRLGCHVVACDSYSGAPAMQLSDEFEVFDMLNGELLRSAVNKHNPDFIVPEIEAIRTEVLVELELGGIKVIPSARAVNLTMNRDRIRDRASELKLRTARFQYAESSEELLDVAAHIGYPVVVKPVMSSSGKGQSIARSSKDIDHNWQHAYDHMRGDRVKVIVEEFIEFDYEITMLTVRQQHGPTLFCEPIGHVQERGDYQYSWQPISMKPNMLADARQMADRITADLGGVGLFGVEFFVTKDEVIFSELSPRPHDTGMTTLISQDLNEFDLHARAILGLPIPHIQCFGGASAVILADRYSESPRYSGIEKAMAIPGVDVRIFNKPTSRPFRRMGIVLARGENSLSMAREAASLIRVE